MTRLDPTNNDHGLHDLSRKIRNTEILVLIITSLIMPLILIIR